MLFWYFSLIPLIAFVDETVYSVLGGVLPGLLHPVCKHIIKRFGSSNVIDQNYCIGSLIVRLCDPSEPLLSRCVPYLQLHITLVDVE